MPNFICPRCGGNLLGPIEDPIERKAGVPLLYDECLQCSRHYYPSKIALARSGLIEKMKTNFTNMPEHQKLGLSSKRPAVLPNEGNLKGVRFFKVF